MAYVKGFCYMQCRQEWKNTRVWCILTVLHAVLQIHSDSPLGLLLEHDHAPMQHALTEITLHINELVGSWSEMSLARLHFLKLCMLFLHQ